MRSRNKVSVGEPAEGSFILCKKKKQHGPKEIGESPNYNECKIELNILL